MGMEMLYLGISVILVGALIGGLGIVVPIMLGKYEKKWYRTVFRVSVIIGVVLGLVGLVIAINAATHIY